MTRSVAIEKLQNFFLMPASPRPLAVLRIGLALILIVQAFLLRNFVLDFFSQDGIIQGDLANYFISPYTPRLSWLVNALSPFNVNETACIYGTCSVYGMSLIFLGTGLFTRTASLVTWFLHWTLINTSRTTSYGVDLYAHVFLFYLIWIPAGNAFSLDVALGYRSDEATSEARLGLRIIQLHLCISYFLSGLEKARGDQWWNGELLWRALSLPVYHQFDMSWLAFWPLLSKLGGWTTLFFEIGYCLFIWPKFTRRIWIAGIVFLHLGIAVLLGLDLFGGIMCLLTLAAFGVPTKVSEVRKPMLCPVQS
ncbi:MAG: HTTM domain-containing protein [Bdellovibrionia bacterium]